MRSIKNSLGLQQDELAALLGITRSQWAMYETGKRDLPLRAKQLLANLLTAVRENKSINPSLRSLQDYQRLRAKNDLDEALGINAYEENLLDKKIARAKNKRQEGETVLQLMGVLKTLPNVNVGLINQIEKRALNLVKKYSEQLLVKLELKREKLMYEKQLLIQKRQEYKNDTADDFV